MFTMRFDITVGDWRLGMVEKVEVRRSVEQLSDTAVITLPGAEYNVALDVEQKIHRGDRVVINLGYEEVGMVQEFEGWLQRIGTDNGAIILECEDDLASRWTAATAGPTGSSSSTPPLASTC